jgi:hypothetical protein
MKYHRKHFFCAWRVRQKSEKASEGENKNRFGKDRGEFGRESKKEAQSYQSENSDHSPKLLKYQK